MEHLPKELGLDRVAIMPDTSGWDTVYAIKFTDVNKAIANQKVSPPDFFQPDASDPNTSLGGDWGDWKLAAGGSNQIVAMRLPIPTMTLKRSGQDDKTYTDTNCDITLRLTVARTGQEGVRGGEIQEIRLANAPSGDVAIQSLDSDVAEPDLITKGLINSLLRQWLDENIGVFDMAFASVDVGSKASEAGEATRFDWLAPKKIGYAVNDQGSVDTGIFAVLAITDDKPKPSVHSVSPAAIPQGAKSGFLISQAKFLEKLIMPGLPGLYFRDDERTVSATLDDFRVNQNNQIVNTRKLYVEKLAVEDGVEVEPYIEKDKLLVGVDFDRLTINMEGFSYDWPKGLIKGATLRSDFEQKLQLRLGASEAFLLEETSTDLVRGTIEKTGTLKTMEIVVPVVTSMVLAVAGFAAGRAISGTAQAAQQGPNVLVGGVGTTVQNTAQMTGQVAAQTAGQTVAPVAGCMSAGAVKLLGTVLGAMVGSGSGFILPLIAAAEKGDAEAAVALSMKPFMTRALAPVTWPLGGAQDEFGITSLTLNGVMQAGINPNQGA